MFVKDLVLELRSRDLAWIVAGLILAIVVSGPFGSYAILDFWQRLAFWTPVILVGITGYISVRILVSYLFGPKDRDLAAVLAALAYALIAAPFFGLLFRVAFGPYFGTLAGWGEICTLIFLVSLGIYFLRSPDRDLTSRNTAQTDGDMAEEVKIDPVATPKLLERLDPDKRGMIRALQVRDHYVEVSTDKGISSLLMRLSDAISELPPELGTQVHRSFWVAWAAIKEVEHQGARVYLRLTCGLLVPVSRSNRVKLEKRGLLIAVPVGAGQGRTNGGYSKGE